MAFFDFLTGADEAAKEAAKATKKSLAFATQGRDQAANILRPGANYQPAMGQLNALAGLDGRQAQQNAFGQFQESPEIQFQREQGLEAINRRPGQFSGRTLADLDKFGQGVASQSYGDYFGRLNDLYKTSLGTAGNLAGVYSNAGNNLANIQMQGGQQQAQYAGQAGGVFGDLLSQGAALAAYAYGAKKPGASASSYGG